ncbi:MAG: glycine--tRNA ligase [Candidatus Micrarchaeota archaeon]
MPELHERIYEIALKRAIFVPSNEIYLPTAGFYDYGPVGAAIRRKIIAEWRKAFISNEGNHEVETALILPEIVLKASGHVGHFSDPLVECEKCKKQFRADHLIEDKGKPGPQTMKLEETGKAIEELKIACPDCEGKLSEAKPFNLMFKTNIGAAEGNPGYTRPETAQGIFLIFPRIFRYSGSKLPLGIAQIGKSFRNEISPRQGLIRLREFSQMELEYFFDPEKGSHIRFEKLKGTKIRLYLREEQANNSEKCLDTTVGEAVSKGILPNEIFAYYMALTQLFYEGMGISFDSLRFRQMREDEMPHYSKANFDIEVKLSYGWQETVGIAYRTDFDLKSHAEMSKKDLSVFLEIEKKKLLPHVIEPSFGLERLFWSILENCYRKEKDREWDWLALPTKIAPYEVAVLPLMKKDGLAEKAQEIAEELRKKGLDVLYDESGSIGKRYARADEIGVPFCITVDYDTLKLETATVRFRDDGKQERVETGELVRYIWKAVESNRTTL